MRPIRSAVLLLLPALLPAQSSSPIQQFFAAVFEEQLRENPELATTIGRHEYDDRWTDWSNAARDRRRHQTEGRLQELEKRFPLAALSEQDRLSARLLRYELEQRLATEWLDAYVLRVSQMHGFHVGVYLTIDQMPHRTVRDYENIVARLNAVPVFVDQNIALLDEAIERSDAQPRLVSDLVAKQLAAQMAQDSGKTALLVAFRQFPSSIPKEEQDKLQARAADAYDHRFPPAWRKLHAYITGKYAGRARASTGLSAIPDGKKAYALLVRRSTTTSLSPGEIHKLGESEVARIEKEMEAVAQETGFTGTLAEFDRKLNASPEQRFHSREEMLAYCRNIAKIIEPELPSLFLRIPPLLYGVRAIPEDREQATATNAQRPSPDGTRPGWFNLNTYQPEKQVKYDKESLVLHEAVPGHIFQGSLAQSIPDLPDFRKYYSTTAYQEGWALYAESLGSGLGLYRDPYSRFGQLASERFRAVRLVVDTGLHELGWTRGQAVAYFERHAPGEPIMEIDRYIAWPGQALGYKMGQLKIKQLRDTAERELGPKFDIREYHDVVLRNGALPLDLLEEEVRAYIKRIAGPRAAATHDSSGPVS